MNDFTLSPPLRRCHVRLTSALFEQFRTLTDSLVREHEYHFVAGGPSEDRKRQWIIFLVDERGAERVTAFLQARRVREKARIR